jgi:PKHD-type hydroxylase
MAHPKLPFLDSWAPMIHAEGAFAAEACQRILALGRPQREGEIAGPNADRDYRDSRVAWIRPDDDSRWLFEALMGFVKGANERHFRMDLAGFTEPLQVAAYGPGQFDDWHLDYGNERFSIRKLSFIVQLSDPAEYEGGAVEVLCAKEPRQAPRSRGAMILFPSYILHRVAPVTRGTRHSLVGWIGGPPLR